MVPAAGLSMGPGPSSLLVLVLCLGQAIHMQEGLQVLSSPLPSHMAHMGFQDPQYKKTGTGCQEGRRHGGNRGLLPKPSIRAEPGPVIPRGQPATIVCGGPAWAESFCLVRKNRRSSLPDQKNVSEGRSQGTEARFHIDTVNEFTGSYWCRYLTGSSWSEPSEILELKVADEDVTPPPSEPPESSAPTPSHTKPPTTAESSTSRAALQGTDAPLLGHTQIKSRDTNTSGLSTEHLYILVGICVASLLCLLLLALLLVYRQHRKKRGPPSSKGEEPRPQERLSPTADLTERPADEATTVDALPEENGDMHSPSPAAGGPQEVTYAQLDQRALTRRAARAESPQPTEPTAESSMYAAFPRH